MLHSEISHSITTQLANQRLCLLCTGGREGTWVVPVRFRSSGLNLYCLVPRWTDIEFHIEQNPDVLIIISLAIVDALRWIQYSGKAEFVSTSEWTNLLSQGERERFRDELYKTIHVIPKRIDYIDEEKGWGVRETIEF